MKILLTGASGFIGANLLKWLGSRYQIVAPTSAELNLLDENAVREYLRAGRFDVVMHAATTRSNRRTGAPADMLDRNCRMFFNLVRSRELFGRMLHFGSGAEYSRAGLPAQVQESYFDSRVPTDAYGFSKYICSKYAERLETVTVLRLFGVFGPGEDCTVRFISNACARVVKGLPIVIRQNVKFDYLDVADLAGLTSRFLEHAPRHKAYNVCRGRSYTLLELAELVAEVSGCNPEIVIGNRAMAPEYSGDNSRMLDEMGPHQFREMKDSICELYRWYQANASQIDTRQLQFDDSE
jgi:GDP-L-fucose synthase